MGKKMKEVIMQAFFKIAGMLPAKKKLIVFESFVGKQFSCHPRAMYEYLQEHYPDYKMVWSAQKEFAPKFKKHGLKIVYRNSWRWMWTYAFAKYWVSNSRLPDVLVKPKRTTYIQTWHGTPLKKLVFDMEEVHMPGLNKESHRNAFYNETRKWDILLSPNSYSTDILKRAFRFENTLIETGSPRNDALIKQNNEEHINHLKEKLEIPFDKKVILYAPTWRDDEFYNKDDFKFQLPMNLRKWQEQFGEEYVLLLRMHYFVAENFDLGEFTGFAYDFSNQVDINDLYLVSDVLITDYSSVFFDYINLRRPIIFYMFDLEKYRDKLRGFYFDIENEAPGPIVRTEGALKEKLEELAISGTFADYQEVYERFYHRFCSLEDGEATKRFVDEAILGITPSYSCQPLESLVN